MIAFMGSGAKDDQLTIAALGVLAFALADVSHEALGHGIATLAVGGKVDFLTTCYLDSSVVYSKWIPAAGGLCNLAVGLVSLAVLRMLPHLGSLPRYFLVLVAAFNLFFAFGYPAYSGIAQFGDWAAVINGLEPRWSWRALLVIVSVVGYYLTMKWLIHPMTPFAGSQDDRASQGSRTARMLPMTLTPYVTAMVLACLAAALNPRGPMLILTSGLPTAAAAFGLTQMDHLVRPGSHNAAESAPPIQRNAVWIAAAGIASVFFVLVLGRGVRFH